MSRGYVRVTDPAFAHARESDTITCSHCNRVVEIHDLATGKPKPAVVVHCHQCDRKTCVPCAETGRCTPFERKLEAMEARGRLLAAVGV